MKNNRFKRVLFMGIIFLSGFAALSGVVMVLWNQLIPGIFQLRAIGYFEAMGLLVLGRILFGGFHFRGGSWNQRKEKMNAVFREKMMQMTPEEREKFKQQWKERCNK